ncbi:transporter substrate-binding domain-containing protein [Vogesella sp. DC21W]|uniref:Transporter substrate-binding domain-containing protein n=1 Tax=Vogesella aquatica TaxID=2984206 RepID=A0ABT5IYU3_9NEIS|nr:transporter substrate-binding domain-containing protein [Vogesella aquatica]MDC7717745.1 transporter substrate-binding domain-containing protein [Vogesella aquatica]
MLKPVLSCLLLLLPCAHGLALRIATGELPPYATQARPDQGVALQIVRRAFALAGHQVEYQFMPWTRALEESANGRWDATAYWGNNPERNARFLASDTVLVEQWVFVHRRDMRFDWNTLADLQPYRLAIIANYTYTPEMWQLLHQGRLQGDATPDDLLALRKLLARRVEVVPIERNVACYLLARHFRPAEAEKLQVHPRLLTDRFTTHLLLPRRQPASAALLADFNRGLQQLKASGEHARLLKGVGCPRGW